MQIHWETVLSLSMRHRVFPLIHQVLGRQSSLAVPDRVMEQLNAARRDNVFRMMALTAELGRIVDLLQKASIPVVALKGPVLSHLLYGDAALRPAKDLDLLIAPDDLEKANQVMLQTGYRLKKATNGLSISQMKRYFFNTAHHLEYQATDKAVVIELHWRFHEHCYFDYNGSPFDRPRCQATSIGSTSVCHPESVDNLLYLAFHGFVHGWFRLRWLMDFALQLRSTRSDAWERIVINAKQGDLFHLLLPGILLAHCLLDIPLPASVECLLPTTGRRRTLKGILKPSLLLINGPETWGAGRARMGKGFVIKKLNSFAFHRHFISQMRYILNHFLPKPVDWDTLALPESLFFLYYFLRPALWCRRRLKPKTGNKHFPAIK
ncbi:MAG: nucleotidyltransferase family protein [Desulfatitalea sp.]|nr:nucleotidyltransferase family protein [Desulfatitalea sp.]NNK01371.1 nucleotidyltransferase family protein [Desulfatitalea sp.]